MTSTGIISNNIELIEMVKQIDVYWLAYSAPALEIDKIPQHIELLICDLDCVSALSLADFPRKLFPSLGIFAIISANDLDDLDSLLNYVDDYTVHPVHSVVLQRRLSQMDKTRNIARILINLQNSLRPHLTSSVGYAELLRLWFHGNESVREEDPEEFIKRIISDQKDMTNILNNEVSNSLR